MVKKSGKYNIDAVLRFLILLGFSLFFLVTVQTGKVQLFVHPRIVPYMIFGVVAMLAIALFVLDDVFKPQRKKVKVLTYMLFIIPLVMAFSLPEKDMGSDLMSYGVARAEGQPGGTTRGSYSAAGSQNTDQALADRAASEAAGLKLQGDILIMDDRNFIKLVDEIYNNLSRYEGKKIQVTGFVFKDKKFKANEFVTARLMMTCCAADMQPTGLLARYNKASELRQDSWFKFTGKIARGEFQGQQTPVIDIDSVVKAEKPENEYVYPY